MAFRVKIKNKKELIEGLKQLKEINALGSEIGFGTCLDDSWNTDDIITEKINVWYDEKDEDDICEFSIAVDDRPIMNNYKELLGEKNIVVTLTTVYDVRQGDIYPQLVKYEDMINETKKLCE